VNNVETDSSGRTGLVIYTNSAVILNNVTARYNVDGGIDVENDNAAKQPVTATGIFADDNQATGFSILTSGTVTLKNIEASGNSINYSTITSGDKIQDALYDGQDEWNFSLSSPTDNYINVHSLGTVQLSLFHQVLLPFPHWVLVSGQTSTGTDPTLGNPSLPAGTYQVRVSGDNTGWYTIWMGTTPGGEPFSPTISSTSDGVNLQNTSNGSTGAVSLTNTDPTLYKINGNGREGLIFASAGGISLTRVSANANGLTGINASNTTNTQPMTLITVSASNNKGNGINIPMKGNLTAAGINCNNNGVFGFNIDTFGNVSILADPAKTNSNFNGNMVDGLKISTNGTINLQQTVANNNLQNGLSISNNSGTGNVTATNITANSNGSMGLSVTTKGAVILSGGTFNDNIGQPIKIDNSSADNSHIQPVTLTNVTVNHGGGESGVQVVSKGQITLNSVNVSFDTGTETDGAVLNNIATGTAGISVTNSSFNNNGAIGLLIITNGTVSLSGVTAQLNGADGLNIGGAGDATALGVTVSNSVFNNNQSYGLIMYVTGPIVLTNITAQGNTNFGALVDNHLTLNKPLVTINSTGTFTNNFSNNGGTGLGVDSNGTISASNTTANGNGTGYFGLLLFTRMGTVTVTNVTANQNDTGLTITTQMDVTLNNVNALNNTYGGASIHVTPGLKRPVTITRSNFNGNQTAGGLFVNTDGVITLNHVSANGNGSYGASLDNSAGTSGVNVLNTLGANVFNDNLLGDGLQVTSKGNIVVNGITANNNNGDGAELDAYVSGNGSGTVMVTGGLFKYNYGNGSHLQMAGLFVYSKNLVGISKVQSFMNGASTNGYGTYVETSAHNLSITNSAFIGNYSSGIYAVVGGGTVTLTNTTYFGNCTSTGSILDNLVIP
jgi:hypothetical protein